MATKTSECVKWYLQALGDSRSGRTMIAAAGTLAAGALLYKLALKCGYLHIPLLKIDPERIVANGAKYVKLDDGRIIEYWVFGSEEKDARIHVHMPPGMMSGQFLAKLPDTVALMKDLNVKVIFRPSRATV